ncbi:MAG: Gfo/Idh/MocA family oxidoreductase [Candidatus Bathyarchaeia archaeon]
MSGYVRFGIIGTGVGADFCARGFSTLTSDEKAKLVAVTSRSEEHAEEFARKWGLKLWYTDYMEMLRKADIDAVIINSPHYLHCQMSLDAIELGKNVLVDKPIAINLKEADTMIEAAKRRGVKLGVILQSRFDPIYRRIKKAAEQGIFGRLILGDAIVKWYRTQEYYEKNPWRGCWATEGGGALINQAIHTVDLLVWIMGSPKCLWAQMDTVAHKIDVEDLAIASIRFSNNALGVVQGSTAIYPGFPTRLEIHGTAGTAVVEGEMLKKWVIVGQEEESTEQVKEGLQSWSRPELMPAVNHASLIMDFAQAILEDRSPYVDGEEGRKSLELVKAIYKSSLTNSRVDFPFKE